LKKKKISNYSKKVEEYAMMYITKVWGDNDEFEVRSYESGRTIWYKDGEIHRDDGPAIKEKNGDEFWYSKGKIHRDDGPAIVLSEGSKFWMKEGLNHREDGPAIEYASGFKAYYENGDKTGWTCNSFFDS
jgi:hypothetical protein